MTQPLCLFDYKYSYQDKNGRRLYLFSLFLVLFLKYFFKLHNTSLRICITSSNRIFVKSIFTSKDIRIFWINIPNPLSNFKNSLTIMIEYSFSTGSSSRLRNLASLCLRDFVIEKTGLKETSLLCNFSKRYNVGLIEPISLISLHNSWLNYLLGPMSYSISFIFFSFCCIKTSFLIRTQRPNILL